MRRRPRGCFKRVDDVAGHAVVHDVKKAGLRAGPSQRFYLFWVVELFQVQYRDALGSNGGRRGGER